MDAKEMVNTIDTKPGLGDIARAFFKIGAMSYGGPAIMGIMQVEIQEKRKWVDKEKFVEGLSVVNLLPGPLATQLAIFLGHETGGIVGGIVAGVCFIVPAFVVMLVLSALYVTFGALPSLQHAFYGIGPVVIGIFAVAVYRLGKSAIKEYSQVAIAVAAVVLLTPAGLVGTLLAAGCAGLALFYSWRVGLISFLVLAAAFAAFYLFGGSIGDLQAPAAATGTVPGPDSASLSAMGIFFLKVVAFTFVGGFTMLAFIEEQVVNQFGWLTPRIRRRTGAGAAHARPGAQPGGFRRLQTVRHARRRGRDNDDLPAVVPDDPLGAAAAARTEGPAVAQGVYARREPGGDRDAGGRAGADGAARRPRHLHLGHSRAHHRPHAVLQQVGDVFLHGRRRDHRPAHARQGVGTDTRPDKIEHDAEKWVPVFGKHHDQSIS